jgi:hypothetical protein
MRIFRFFTAVIFLALAAPSPKAAEPAGSSQAPHSRAPQAGPLKPGRTAGVQKAQQAHAGLALIGAGAIVAVVVVAAGSGGGGGGVAQNNMQIAPATTTP